MPMPDDYDSTEQCAIENERADLISKISTLMDAVDKLRTQNDDLKSRFDSEDLRVLRFIHDRMIEVHGESKNISYMHAIRRVIVKMQKAGE